MEKQNKESILEDPVSAAIAQLQTSFILSDDKGLIFWVYILLPNDKESDVVNEKLYEDLYNEFTSQGSAQQHLAELTIENLIFLRKECLKDNNVRDKIEQIKNLTIQQAAANSIVQQAYMELEKE